MSLHYLDEIPEGWLSVEEAPEGEVVGMATIDPRLWDRLATYDASVPTAPSAGRIYRRRQGGTNAFAGQWRAPFDLIYIVRDAPPGDPRGGQLHHPFRVERAPHPKEEADG